MAIDAQDCGSSSSAPFSSEAFKMSLSISAADGLLGNTVTGTGAAITAAAPAAVTTPVAGNPRLEAATSAASSCSNATVSAAPRPRRVLRSAKKAASAG